MKKNMLTAIALMLMSCGALAQETNLNADNEQLLIAPIEQAMTEMKQDFNQSMLNDVQSQLQDTFKTLRLEKNAAAKEGTIASL